MSNCEIVDNIACGKSFRYCRVHKVEERDCPKYATTPAPLNFVVDAKAIAPKRTGFKVGDKVRYVGPYLQHWDSSKIYVVDWHRHCNEPYVERIPGSGEGALVNSWSKEDWSHA